MMSNVFHTEAFVALASSQVESLTAFYSAVFQIEPVLNTPAYAEFRLAGLRIAIFVPKADNADEFSAKSSGPMSLCIEVNDLASEIAHLTTLGHAPPGEIMHTSHGQEIYAYDPDGNRLIFHQS
ncbi:MAG: VOC family protein [Cyanobacteria bacterium P01_F01_bin.53]